MNNLSRRNFLKFAGGTAGMLALAACVPSVQAPAGGEAGEAPAAEPGTLWVLHKQDFHPEYNEFIRQHIVDFAAANNLQLDVAFTAGFGGGAEIQKVAAAVQSGDAPDVWIDNINPFQLQQAGVLQPVTDLQQEVIAKWGEPAPRARNAAYLDGEYVGAILHCRSDGGFARQDVFDAAGVDIAAVRDFDALREAALAASDPAKEMWGWGMTVNRSGDAGWLIWRVLHGWGAYWVDETGQYVTLDTPEAVTAVEWIVDTFTNPQWEPMLPPGVLSWTDSSNNEAYLGGKIAYTQNAGTVYAKAVVDGNPVADVTVFHPPVGGPVLKEFNGLGGMNAHHIQGSKNPTKARELIMSFFEDDVMSGIFQSAISYAVPAYEPQWDWDVIQNDRISPLLKPVALDPSGWNAGAFPGPTTAQMGAVETSFLHTDLIANVLNGQMTAAESVKNAHEQSIAIFKEFGAPGERA